MPAVTIRTTTREDLPAMDAVFRAAIGELYRRHAFEPPNPSPDAFSAQHGHLLEHERDRCVAAEVEGTLVGYAAAFVRGETWFLSSLFVRPENQGSGVGAALLARVWDAPAPRRLTLTDAIQPVSNGLYARRGLIPATPVLALAGTPRAAPPGGLEPADPDGAALRALDLSAYGFDRAADHAFWQAGPAKATLWLRGGEPAAYAYSWRGGRIGPVAGADPEAAGIAVRAELARLHGRPAQVLAPGSAAAVVEAALASGLRIAGPPGLLLVSRPNDPPTALAIGSYTLF